MAKPAYTATRRLSDAQLLLTEFRFAHPETSIENLNLGIPDPETNPVIIGFYDETPAGGRLANPNVPFVRCCHCGLRRHWRGHVVRGDQGQIYIIGASKCGREHYGIQYDHAETAFKAEQARQRALQRWRNMRALVPIYRAEVSELLASPALTALELKCAELRRASPQGFRKVLRIASTSESMVEILQVRDNHAETVRHEHFERAIAAYNALPPDERSRRKRDGLKPEKETDPILVRTSTPLGHLVGARSFIERNDVRTLALALDKTLFSIDAIDRTGTDTVATRDLSKLLREMTDRPRSLMDALADASFTELFFGKDNLDRLERWSHSEARFSYRRDGTALIVEDTSNGFSRTEALGTLDFPRLTTIDSSRYFDEEFMPLMAVL